MHSGLELNADDKAVKRDYSHVNGSSDTKSKTPQQKSGEALLRHILNNDCVEGSSFSFK